VTWAEVVAVVETGPAPEASLPTVASLRRAHPDIEIVASSCAPAGDRALAELGVATATGSLASVVNRVWDTRRCHVLAVPGPAAFPPAALDQAIAIVESDIRVATVSFFSGAAGFLSFPHRNTPAAYQVEDLDEEVTTRRLRTTGPDLAAAPIPYAAGPAVLLSSYALSAVGPLADLDGTVAEVVLVDYSLRARRKGFLDLLDPSTFCGRLFDVGVPYDDALVGVEVARMSTRRPALADAASIRAESDLAGSPLSVVHAAARAKVLGLRVLLDGSCLGPREMGTQVQAVALIEALARRPDVAQVSVALTQEVPAYARAALGAPKVDARPVPAGDLAGFGAVDIGHQPFQPEGPFGVESLRRVAARSLITMLDLIAYHGRSYHRSAADWTGYRRRVADAVRQADGVLVPSDDVRRMVEVERLPVDGDRLFTVPLGADHLTGDESDAVPGELLARGFVAGEFALVLGATYTHKNRDLAVRAVLELRRRGRALSLVMVGTAVFGSSRVLEAAASQGMDDLYVLPDVTSAERNWLLRHAAVLLYPTSAEGFGLVPFEAAVFGTPTVLVPVGPLERVAAGLPVVAPDWDAGSLADAGELLLEDPATATAQVTAALATGRRLTWEATASTLVDVYRSVLARPPRGPSA
jgi:glycosyltransferase involved in cell wall biosynthesis